MKIKFINLIFFVFIAILVVISVAVNKYQDALSVANAIEENSIEKELNTNTLNQIKLIDNHAIYELDDDRKIYKLYVTILPPKENNSVTFKDLNTNYMQSNGNYVIDAFDYVSEIFFSEKPDSGSGTVPNGTIEIRGQSSRNAQKKSYKIKLFDSTERWDDFRILNLNKHYSDRFRIINKFSYDLFEKIPDFVSFRTRFVHLYIKDLSGGASKTSYEDYGLFTFIEQPNKQFLKQHNLDINGHLYKAEFFEFFRYEDNLKSKDDLTFSESSFEEILEVMGNDNHDKLLEMLDAVNNYNLNIDDVIEQYFDKDNLLTWLSVNILLDNIDTNSRNFILYSPLNSDKWFFLPWDYDGSLKNESQKRSTWQKNISNYWGMVIFNRMFKNPENIDALSRKMEEISQIINKENSKKLIDNYYPQIRQILYNSSDTEDMDYSEEDYKDNLYGIINMMENNKNDYYHSLETPMPFFLGTPTLDNDEYYFSWTSSYDFQGDELNYTFILSTDYNFKNIIAKYENLKTVFCKVSKLKPGTYYWKVIVYDEKGNWQLPFDTLRVSSSNIHGTQMLRVK